MSRASYIHTLVRGVVIEEGHVLLAHAKGASNTFLPGGHVGVGERLEKALSRELHEELGLPVQIGRYLGLIEHQWRVGLAFQHELNHVFSATLASADRLRRLVSREPHLEFLWVPTTDLEKHDLRPPPLIELIRRPLHPDAGAFFASTLAP